MNELFSNTYQENHGRILGFFRNQLRKIGFKGDRKAESERLTQDAAIKAYEECTVERCQRYGENQGALPEECVKVGLTVLLFVIAKNVWFRFVRPRSKSKPLELELDSFVSKLADDLPTVDGLTPEEKLEKISAFLPAPILHIFVRVSQGETYEILAKENGCSVAALTQRIHRWRKKVKRHLKKK
jgi:hypothetical protein